ncbi:MAG TPA: hypothetical protein VFS00_16730, partial [Polyangiaceae bacterium]|nr:hypothetical protein [Polyangiaceae bacterium]
ELAFRGINLANFSLSRQMEFDADLHAVRLAGSDAIVSGLWKAERAALAYDHAFSGLASVAEHGKFSADVFEHVEGSLGRLEAHFAKVQGAEERLGPLLARYERGPKLHFSSPVEKVSALWESHPPNHEREANVKRVYVAAPADERPALSLFAGGPALRERLSRLAYEAKGFSPKQALPAREVAGLVEEESGEMHQPAHYHGLYEDRVVRPGDVEALARAIDAEAEAGTLEPAALRAEAAEFTGEALAERMARLAELQAESGLVDALRDGRAKLKGKTAKFRGRDLTRAEILALEGEIDAELKAAHEALERADRAVFRHHYARSAGDPEARRELVHRYEF